MRHFFRLWLPELWDNKYLCCIKSLSLWWIVMAAIGNSIHSAKIKSLLWAPIFHHCPCCFQIWVNIWWIDNQKNQLQPVPLHSSHPLTIPPTISTSQIRSVPIPTYILTALFQLFIREFEGDFKVHTVLYF